MTDIEGAWEGRPPGTRPFAEMGSHPPALAIRGAALGGVGLYAGHLRRFADRPAVVSRGMTEAEALPELAEALRTR